MEQTATRKCVFCDDIAVFFCYECKEAFCKQCKGKHDKLISTKNHLMTDLKRVDLTQFRSAPDCTEHEMEYSYYCTKCVIGICNDCVLTKHKGHDIAGVKTIADTLRKSASTKVTEIKKRINYLSKSISKVKSEYLPQLHFQAQTIISSIKSTAEEVKKIVDWKAEMAIGDVCDLEKSKEAEIQSSLITIGRSFKSQDVLCRNLEKLLTEEHAVTFFVSYQSLKNEIDMFDYDVGKVEPKHIPSVSTKSLCDVFIQGINMHVQSSSHANLKTETTDVEGATPTEKKRRVQRFEGGSTEPKRGYNKSLIYVPKPDKQEPEEAKSQAPSMPIESTAEHIQHAHVLGIFPDLPRADIPEDDSQDDSKILQLMWTHQDYFDQKVLSRAQAEYNFYRVLEKEWKRAVSGEKSLTLEEIKYQKFNLKMFMELSLTRHLYAVILTILEQSKDKKPAEAAAEEYFRLSVLEQTMIQQKIKLAITQGIDMDSEHYKELYQDMKTRFKISGSQVQLRQAAEIKMIPFSEYLKLKEIKTQQQTQIEELASRLSGIVSQQLAEEDAGFTDLEDKNGPQNLVERFAELFDETWSSAYESLRPKQEGKEEDEKTMDLLQNVAKVSQEQIERTVGGMISPIVNPMNTAESKEFHTTADAIRRKTEHMAKEYRKVVAPPTIKILQKEIYAKELKTKLLREPVENEVHKYVQECVDLIWYMCIQQPAMEIVWAKPGDKFNREHFRFCGKKGKTYKLTVWPAVFLHKDGPLVAPGYAVPE